MNNHLVPTVITDVNGVVKTVHKSPPVISKDERRAAMLPPVTAMLVKPAPSFITDPYGTRWEVAPEGYTGAKCAKCGEWIMDTADFHTTLPYHCDFCGAIYFTGNDVGIRSDAVRFFDVQEVKNADWFHVSIRSDWFTSINSYSADEKPFVHAGSEQATGSRIISVTEASRLPEDTPFFLHRLRIKDQAPVAPIIQVDDDEGAPKNHLEAVDSYEAMKEFGEERLAHYTSRSIVRYVNGFEDPGSMSLMMTGDMFEVVDVTTVTPADYAHWFEG